MTSLPALLTRVAGRRNPCLTWYSEDERVELSGFVLANWVTKTTHLLVDELDVGPGRPVRVDLPAHWRGLVWSLAALRAGGTLVDHGPAAVVTDDPERWPDAADLVVVALPALARTAGSVPPGAIDANAAVMTYPDRPGAWAPAPADGLALAEAEVRHAELVDWATARAGWVHAGARVLAAGADPRDLLAVTLAALASDGSVVLGNAEWAATMLADRERRARLVESERVDVNLLPDDPDRGAPGAGGRA
ncbi:TIGR03089 family protein [Isoptericola sp. b441]|uniref:TIGR03089 family protein n=1 Tax=Actinotalea lenta TaxID=3064654 RepID=A0ABT9DCD5_9CELL|nr:MULTISPECIES: TIGR03089 family protein [unclassified Isoptericola]MDO8108569.1 TIGR03089 family protein [Isoptericola sp. b441]MDO8119979.1 TIGR03089 family protein [Isoptericola sp. b490]